MTFVISAKCDSSGKIVIDQLQRLDCSGVEVGGGADGIAGRARDLYSGKLLRFFTILAAWLAEENEIKDFIVPPTSSEYEELIGCDIAAIAQEAEELAQLSRNAGPKKQKFKQESSTVTDDNEGRESKTGTGDLLKQNERNHWAHSFLYDGGKEIFDFSRGSIKFRRAHSSATVKIHCHGQELSDALQLKVLLRLISLSQNPATQGLLAYRGIRENLKYNITFGDTPHPATLDSRFLGKEYQYFTAAMEFDRISFKPMPNFVIGLHPSDSDLGQSISEQRAIYREVFDCVGQHQSHFEHLMDCAAKASSPDSRNESLSKVGHFKASVNGKEVFLQKIERVRSGWNLIFPVPDCLQNNLFLRFALEVAGFQPRSLHRFPIVFSEPTRSAEVIFNCFGARETIRDVDYFVGCRVTSTGSTADATLHRSRMEFRLTRDHQDFFLPGEGAVVFWNPVEADPQS